MGFGTWEGGQRSTASNAPHEFEAGRLGRQVCLKSNVGLMDVAVFTPRNAYSQHHVRFREVSQRFSCSVLHCIEITRSAGGNDRISGAVRENTHVCTPIRWAETVPVGWHAFGWEAGVVKVWPRCGSTHGGCCAPVNQCSGFKLGGIWAGRLSRGQDSEH